VFYDSGVAIGDGSTHNISLEDALPLTVGEIMIAHPRTFPSDIGIGEVRRAFEQPSQRLVLLVDGSTFRGAIDRDSLDSQDPDSAPAVTCASREIATVTPATPLIDALELIERSREPRLVVLDEDGCTLRGLLCYSRSSASFCVK
jgi:CBS domain containing-hemolysin-like protein